MSIVEFLEARIAEDENAASVAAMAPRWPAVAALAKQQLAECEFKRAILKFHEGWPVLVETEPLRAAPGDLSYAVRMTSRMAWLTQREYVKRFGTEPPTTPMLRAMAAVYRAHPDWKDEW